MADFPDKVPKQKDIKKSFRFFDLPRELRDRIYRVALVTNLIDIDVVACASDDDDEEMLKAYPSPKLRSTWTSLSKVMTYRLSKPRNCHCGSCQKEPTPQLQLFYVNRQVKEESREIFYKENEFNTILASGLGCIAFFKDRQDACPMIRKLSFDVPLHTADFSYGRWTDRHYKLLFKMLKAGPSLRKLTLNFHGLVPDVTEEKWKCPCDCSNWDHPLLALGAAMGVTGVPTSRTKRLHNNEWKLFKAIAKINNLPRLSINVDFCYHMLDHEAYEDGMFEHEHIRSFIAYLRSKMLKNGEALGTTQIHGYCRVHDEVDDKRYRFHSDDDEYGKSHLKILKHGAHQRSARHDHSDSGSELDGDDDLPDLEDMSDEWEDEEGDEEYDEDEDDDEDDFDGMPPLEPSTDDERPSIPVEDFD